MSAIIGAAGIEVGLNSAKHGGVLALANKETLVCAGNLLKEIALKNSTIIIPVDSEHSAIFQCLRGEKEDAIESITLTASGGPFRDWPLEKLNYVEPREAARHPNWSMGKKISIDSASMFNKGLEVIEASSLFALPKEKINVLIHPQSIVHGFISFKDGASIAQMSSPDMLTAIGFSLNYPDRPHVKVDRLNLSKVHNLNFEEVDFNRWPALRLAYKVIDLKSTAATVYNASKEVASEAFIEGKIGFLDMFVCVDYVVDYLNKKNYFSTNYFGLSEVFESDSLSRKITREYISKSHF
jgi:1-deoxy-D-xylulose-5-phosphate reductoisomerase